MQTENLFLFSLLKTTVHVLENAGNSFWGGFRESKQQQQKQQRQQQNILGYELV
jgi:hypothetical protein